jgi:two-component system phosphate regulon sensor histidine kinase PhoR
LKKRIFIIYLALVLVFALAATLLASTIVLSVARNNLITRLQTEALQIENAIKERGLDAVLEGLISPSRVTLIRPDGSVAYDSWANEPLENHADRPEIKDAQNEGTGVAVRYSQTTKSTAIYVTRAQADGNVLRVAAAERVARGIANSMLPWLIFGLVLLVIFSAVFARYFSGRLLRPITGIDLAKPEEAVVYDELLPLVKKLDEQNRENLAQLAQLEASRQELKTLLEGMHEGFIALNDKGAITLMNPSAQRMLGVKAEDARGRLLMEINRSQAMIDLLSALQEQGSGEGMLQMDGKSYQLFASRIDGTQSAVLIISDQTEKTAGEAMRQRFTANVSHELRTPLTTIRGCAELLVNDMVKPEDQAQFYQKIHQESQRMLTLVEDILRLSSLDEGYLKGLSEQVNLYQVARESCQTLELLAQEKGITLSLTGEDAQVLGDAALLGELCTNLIDNAIKYNKEHGRVDVQVENTPLGAKLTVSDDGIGMSKEHQEHVFERFYRVDKSRSKETGGTGLGLSIVKHAAEVHRAKISLESEDGQGTKIVVGFPAVQKEG